MKATTAGCLLGLGNSPASSLCLPTVSRAKHGKREEPGRLAHACLQIEFAQLVHQHQLL